MSDPRGTRGGIELIATAAFGVESVVACELKTLGYGDSMTENGKVTFRADMDGICRSDLFKRVSGRSR